MEMSKAPIGVAVLKMVNARSAGVTLTVQPTTGDLTKTVVEGNWGLGESVVSGEVTPDSFLVDKTGGSVVSSTISKKTRMVVYKKDGIGMVSVPAEKQDKPCIDERELDEIVRIALEVETYFDMPQDMEWVFDEDMNFPENLFWVQTRPAKFSEKKEDDSEYLAELMTRIFKM
jgi:pyruvate,water dikinase